MPGQLAYAAAVGTQVRWSDGQRYSPGLQCPQRPIEQSLLGGGHSENSPTHAAAGAEGGRETAAASEASTASAASGARPDIATAFVGAHQATATATVAATAAPAAHPAGRPPAEGRKHRAAAWGPLARL